MTDRAVAAETGGALVAEGVGRRYRRRGPWALRGVTLSVRPGSITALVGPNGAGKSTLIRCWIGFERPDEGRVLVLGRDPRRRRADVVASIGYVAQSDSLYRDLTIEDHLRFVESYRRTFDRAGARKRLTSVGLGPERRISQLSAGERAKVALTIALSLRASVLLLDEPMANLDPLARREFLRLLLDEAQGQGTTVVLSSHIVTDVEEACSDLIVLSNGRVLLHDTIERARRGHMTVPAARLDGSHPVGIFAGSSGDLLALVRTDAPPGAEASLEEVVLGYLASGSSPEEIREA
ncbi:MAG TPA: ABC transporter ATP-binding protein [Candidatus Limnocylindrales bacterium]|nr:ABC transporter ATP-binding protein [Candidatus Limnocylindrales bacterium]